MTTDIIYRVRTTARDANERRIKFESYDRAAAIRKRDDLRASRDPKASIIGIPVTR